MGRGTRTARRVTALTGGPVAAIVALGLTGCGAEEALAEKVTEEGVEAAVGAEGEDVELDIDDEGGEVRVEGEDGSSLTMGGQEVPDGFPDDVPLPDADYEVRSAMEVTGEEGHVQLQLALTGDHELADLVEHVEDGLDRAGYEVTGQTTQTQGDLRLSRLQFAGHGQEGMFSARTVDGELTATYMVGDAADQQ